MGTSTITITNPDGQSAIFNGFSFAKPDANRSTVSAQIQACSVKESVTQTQLPDAFKIVIYALTNQYYIQPCITQKLNAINQDGSWGPIPSHNGTIYGFVTSSSYTPPSVTLSLPLIASTCSPPRALLVP